MGYVFDMGNTMNNWQLTRNSFILAGTSFEVRGPIGSLARYEVLDDNRYVCETTFLDVAKRIAQLLAASAR